MYMYVSEVKDGKPFIPCYDPEKCPDVDTASEADLIADGFFKVSIEVLVETIDKDTYVDTVDAYIFVDDTVYVSVKSLGGIV